MFLTQVVASNIAFLIVFVGVDNFFLGGGVPDPMFGGTNLLVMVKLGYTPNFWVIWKCPKSLGLVVVMGRWVGGVNQI